MKESSALRFTPIPSFCHTELKTKFLLAVPRWTRCYAERQTRAGWYPIRKVESIPYDVTGCVTGEHCAEADASVLKVMTAWLNISGGWCRCCVKHGYQNKH